MVLVSYSLNLFYLFGMEQLWGSLWGRGGCFGAEGRPAVMNAIFTLSLFRENLRPWVYFSFYEKWNTISRQ